MEQTKNWKEYIKEFIFNDTELYVNDIPNEKSIEFLEEQIPIIELPDKVIERTYYFRWWTYRKHIRTTPEGHVITEFLPDVPWATTHNAISCAANYHIREGRWLKDSEGVIKDYVNFWLTFPEKMYAYTMWLVAATEEYCQIHGDWKFAEDNFDKFEEYFERRLTRSETETGLFFSEDCEDGMEVGISGNGLRPTINSYVYADAMALSRLAKRKGLTEKQKQYEALAKELKDKILKFLWDGEFFKTIPEEYIKGWKGMRPEIPEEKNVRELIGYVPWCFNIPEPDMAHAFEHLLSTDGFFTDYGLTTAEQRHPRYMEPHKHECLWNGPIWPFGTTHVLLALANALRSDANMDVSRENYVMLLRQYAASHRRTLPDGKVVDWIDENMDPNNGDWLARRILEEQNWPEGKGEYERGKDYNHSMFCDLVLSGLLGIHEDANGKLAVDSLIPEDWMYFRVQNLHFHGERYEIIFDRDGTYYGQGKGIIICRAEILN